MLHRRCPQLAELKLFDIESFDRPALPRRDALPALEGLRVASSAAHQSVWGTATDCSLSSALAGFLSLHKPLELLELRADIGAAGGTALAGALKYAQLVCLIVWVMVDSVPKCA